MQCTVTYDTTMLCLGIYLKSVPRYKVLILEFYHADTLYLCEQGYEDPWLLFEAERGPQVKKFGIH
jgi:hypothetical protein